MKGKRTQKHIFLKLLIFLLMAVQCWNVAFADIGIACECKASSCICFLQLGDAGAAMRGAISLLKEQNYLEDNRVKTTCTEKVQTAVLQFQKDHNLKQTGMLDDETLTLLIWRMSPAELNDRKLLASQDVVWVATGSGEKYHKRINCSGMVSPRKMTQRNAEGLGLEECKRCFAAQ